MSRELTSGVISEITSPDLAPFLLFEGVFASGTLRVWSGIGDLSWNSYTWSGVGSLASISSITEAAETSAQGITVSLSGIPSSLVSLFLGDVRQGSVGKVYLGFMNASNQVIDSPFMLFEGRLDVPSMEESGDSAIISISYESRLIDLERPRESRYTNEDQQREFAGDLGFEFVPSLQDVVINWGRTDSSGKSKPTRQA